MAGNGIKCFLLRKFCITLYIGQIMELLRRFVSDFVGVSWVELRVELTKTPISSVSSMSSHSTASAKCISPLPT